MEIAFIILIALAVSGVLAYIIYRFKTRAKRKEKRKRKKLQEKVNRLSNNQTELTPQQFFELREQTFSQKHDRRRYKKLNFEGVYVLYNSTKNKYYVGQGKRILDRVNMHFTGKGNGDVYADYKYGDNFTIKMIVLERSGYKSLNALERDTIEVFNAQSTGYNKTKGNKD